MGMMSYLWRALRLLWPYRASVVATAGCLLVNIFCRLAVPTLEGGLFDSLVHRSRPAFAAKLALLLAGWAGQTVFQALQRLLAKLMSRNLRFYTLCLRIYK